MRDTMRSENIVSLTVKVISNGLKDRTTLALTLIAPLVIIMVMGYMIGMMGIADPIKIGIINDDRGMGPAKASSPIIEQLDAQEGVELITLTGGDVEGAMKEKRVDAILMFGESFTSDMMQKKSSEIKLVNEGTDMIKGAMTARAINTAAIGAAAKMQGGSAATMPLKISAESYYGKGLKATDFHVPLILGLVTFILGSALGMLVVLNDKSKGRLATAASYTIGLTLFAWVQTLIILLYAVYAMNIGISGDVYQIALMLMMVSATGVTIGVLISSIARSQIQALGLLAFTVIIQLLFDGMIVPVSRFDLYVQVISYATPLTYAFNALKDIAVRGYSIGDMWVECAAIIAIALVSVIIATVALRSAAAGNRVKESAAA